MLSAAALLKQVVITAVGESFTKQTIAASSASRYGVAYGKGKFVAVGFDQKAHVSEDGATWAETSVIPVNGALYDVAYGNGKFVAVCQNSSSYSYSEDGVSWIAGSLPLPSSTYSWGGIAFCNGVFVAHCQYNSYLCYTTSTDGINWTSQASLPAEANAGYGRGVCVANNTFWAFPVNSSNVYYSTDGVTWQKGTHNLSWAAWTIGYKDGIYVAAATNVIGTALWHSSDGFNWTSVSAPQGNYWHIACTESKFIVFIKNSATFALVSDDGVHWKSVSVPTGEYGFSAYNGKVLVSPNGLSSTTVLYSAGKFEPALVDVKDEPITLGVRVATGSYTGSGTYGASNQNTIDVGFEPKVVFILTTQYASNQLLADGFGFFINPRPYGFANFSGNYGMTPGQGGVKSTEYQAAPYVTWNSTGLSWYVTNDSLYQLNSKSAVYHYIAFG